ncbi:MAG TPA: cytosine permease, partial [Woeseiaceae bacterium]|nr:cytosine permease [Woeseiaceae bacterium]
SLLGPIAGIMIVDYFLIRKQSYMLADLYRNGGIYPAWNAAGFIAFLVPVGLTVIAIATATGTGTFRWFYDFSWFTGSLSGALIYYLLSRGK